MKRRIVELNAHGLRIGENHPRALISDHDVELIRELAEGGMRYSLIVAKFEIEQGLAIVLKKIDPTIYGELGECMDCGEEGRLVDGVCAPCRKLDEARNKKWKL